jgi:hypothetical protein
MNRQAAGQGGRILFPGFISGVKIKEVYWHE